MLGEGRVKRKRISKNHTCVCTCVRACMHVCVVNTGVIDTHILTIFEGIVENPGGDELQTSTCHTAGWYSIQKTHKFLTLHLHRLHACAHTVIQNPTSDMDSKLFLIKTFKTEM